MILTSFAKRPAWHQEVLKNRSVAWICGLVLIIAPPLSAQTTSSGLSATSAADSVLNTSTVVLAETNADARDRFADSFARSADAILASQDDQKPEEPAHTGLAAIVYKTLGDFKAFPRRTSTWVILGVGAGAAALGHPADNTLNARIAGSDGVRRFFAPGHVIGATYVQVGTAIGLYVTGRYIIPPKEGEGRTNKWSHVGFDMLRAQIVSQVLVQGMKQAIRRDRPTGECCSFPSGHSAATFATAAVLERHLGYRAAVPTLAIATYVATSRLHDNRHYLSDVLFGAAVGTATGWTVVGTHGRSDYTLVPIARPGGIMIALIRTPVRSS